MTVKVLFCVAIPLFSLWTVSGALAGEQTESRPCFSNVLNISDYPRSEWLSLSPTTAKTYLSFPGMSFECAGNITGMALWMKQSPNLNWLQDLSLTLYVDSIAQERITQSTSESPLPDVINATLKTAVSVQIGSVLQFLFPKPVDKMHRFLPVAFVRSDEPVTTIVPTARKDSTNCNIFGSSVEGGKECRVQPLIQIYFIPEVLPSNTVSVKPIGSSSQQSSLAIFPSPAASFQPTEAIETSKSGGVETMSITMPSMTTSVTDGTSGVPTETLPIFYILLIACLCAAVLVGLLLGTVFLLLCCIRRRRRKNKRVNVEPVDIYDAPHTENGCDKPVPLAQYENLGTPLGETNAQTSRKTALNTGTVAPLCSKSSSNRSGSTEYSHPWYTGLAAEANQPTGAATYELLKATSLEEAYFDVDHDHDYEDPDKVMMDGWKNKVVFHAEIQDIVTSPFIVPTTVERNKMFAQPHDWQTERVYAVYQSVTNMQMSPHLKTPTDGEVYAIPPDTEEEIYQNMSASKFKEFPRPAVTILEHLGTGRYGSVHRGEWSTEGGAQVVAVKILRRGATKVKLLQEAMTMGQFTHPNVLKLLGVITLVEPIMMVMELAENGDLKSNLLAARERIAEVDVVSASHNLFKFSSQVAEGMRYLEGHQFVHQHLSARNVLLDEGHNCKISGFVAAEQGEGAVSAKDESQIRWTSPEAHLCGKYTSSSDVWSYGMVMYEIWSLGRVPFEAMSLPQVLNIINTGYCQPPPAGCPAKVYALMVQCWNPEYRSRPSFGNVCHYLEANKEVALKMCEEGSRSDDASLKLGSPLEEGLRLYMDLQKTYT